jgi:hypothetical protein
MGFFLNQWQEHGEHWGVTLPLPLPTIVAGEVWIVAAEVIIVAVPVTWVAGDVTMVAGFLSLQPLIPDVSVLIK